MTNDSFAFDEGLLDLWIETLQRAKEIGFKVSQPSSSPTELLLELMIDLALQVKNALLQGRAWKERTNPGLKFLEDTRDRHNSGWFVPDVLGNAKSIRINLDEPIDLSYSKELAEWFNRLSLDLVFIKDKHQPPKDFASKGGNAESPKKLKTRSEVYHYFRRRTRKNIK